MTVNTLSSPWSIVGSMDERERIGIEELAAMTPDERLAIIKSATVTDWGQVPASMQARIEAAEADMAAATSSGERFDR